MLTWSFSSPSEAPRNATSKEIGAGSCLNQLAQHLDTF